MGTVRRRRRSAFKPPVALEAVKGQQPLNELATEFGVHPVQSAQWKRQLLEASPAAFEAGSGRGNHAQEQLIENL